jgi:hypothetical protein
MNLLSALFALTIMLAAVGSTKAFAVFTVGGVKMICQTCMCGEMASAGVPLEHCVDFMVTPNTPRPYTKLIRYAENDVRLLAPDGTQSPLASDAAQKRFDEIAGQRNFKQLARLRSTAGLISQQRIERLAKDLQVEIVNSDDLDGAAFETTSQPVSVVVTIRDGKLVALRAITANARFSLGGANYRGTATNRGDKLVLQLDRPLSRESRSQLKIETQLDLDRETGTALDTCGCLPGDFSVENAARLPVVTIAASGRPRHAHRWSTKYRTTDCARW